MGWISEINLNQFGKIRMINKVVTITAAIIIITGISLFSLIKVLSQPKMAVVDTTTLIGNFTESIAAKKKFEQEKSSWDIRAKNLKDSIKAAVDAMAKEYDSAGKTRRVELQDNLKKWNDEYARFTRALKEFSRKREMELLQPVIDKVNSFVKNWGDEHGYDIIYGTAGGGVILTVSDRLNVTSEILADLNELYGNATTEAGNISDGKSESESNSATGKNDPDNKTVDTVAVDSVKK